MTVVIDDIHAYYKITLNKKTEWLSEVIYTDKGNQ